MNRVKEGFGLIEVIVGTAIIAASLVGVIAAFNLYLNVGIRNTDKVKAVYLAEEGLEIARTLRDRSYSTEIISLESGTSYYPFFDGEKWTLSESSAGLIDNKFDRYISFEDVYRRASDDDIVASSSPDEKSIDPDIRKAEVHVLWGGSQETSEKNIFYEGGDTDGNLAAFPSDNAGDGNPAQSFTTESGDSITVPKVGLYIKKASSDPSDIYLEIRETSTVGAVIGTSETIDSSSLSSSLGWSTFTFASPPTLSPDTMYYLRLRSTPPSTDAFSGSAGFVHWGYKQTASSPYSGGDAYRYVGRNSSPGDQGQTLDQYDFSFRVYKSVDGGGEEEIILSTYITNFMKN